MDRIDAPFVGKITTGITPNNLASKTIDFVYNSLPVWRDDPDRPKEQAENKLNLQLCKFLNSNYARNAFPMVHFEHEEYQTKRSSIDIAALPNETITLGAKTYTIYDTIVVIEGKRLPAPSSDREKEYVTGGEKYQRGGIQRFKLKRHGENHEIAAIIGYLQDGLIKDWYTKINNWILDLSNGNIIDVCEWHQSETLTELTLDLTKRMSKCKSTHNRGTNQQPDNILIHHLWINMK
jgi:hypothetical protein